MKNYKKQFSELLEIRAYSISDIKGKSITDKSSEEEKIKALIVLAIETNDYSTFKIKKVLKKKIILQDHASTGVIQQKTINELKYYEDITLDKIVKFLNKKGVESI